MTATFLVLLETAGNQDYIFSTNKLRENIGASQLTYEAGTRWVLEAVERLGGPGLLVLQGEYVDTAATRANLLDPAENEPVQESGTVEVVYATSGKALLLVSGPDAVVARARATGIVSAVTSVALEIAPGLDLCGAVVEMNWQTDRIDKSVADVHKALERARERRPGPRTRFSRLPVVDQCAYSGLPASKTVSEFEGAPPRSISRTSSAKRAGFPAWRARINDLLQRHEATRGRHLPDTPDDLERRFDDLEWTAVVHCDANGLGRLFLTFHFHEAAWGASPAPADWSVHNRDYVSILRELSIEVEVATEHAFAVAVARLPSVDKKKNWVPIVPVLLGGDDFTVMCTGHGALDFTETYLNAFEQATRSGWIEMLRTSEGGHLSASGGVAITKPHFPFHLAYRLAEDLTENAKLVKKKVAGRACSALDFHILFDSTFVDLESIRSKMLVDDGTTLLTRKPYVTTALPPGTATPWVAPRRVSELKARIEWLTKSLEQDEDGLANTQLHDLREALFDGRDGADARLGLIRHRYGRALTSLEETGGGLFAPTHEASITHDTQLLDVMESRPFWTWKEKE